MQTVTPRQPQHNARASTRYRFGAIEIRAEDRVLLIDGKMVEVGLRGFGVLLALVENRARVVSKDELLELAWPGLVVEENNLQQQISALRKLLGQQAIATIPARGYQFTLEETTPPEQANAAEPPVIEPHAMLPGEMAKPPAPDGATVAGWQGKRATVVAFACVLVVLAGSGVWWYANRPMASGALPLTSGANSAPRAPLSIAVLPFANLTGDPNQAYLADGLTAAIADDLTRIRDAYIVDASRSYAFKDKPGLPQQAGVQLGVHFVVAGSVQRDKRRIRIHAQLDDTGSNAQLWSETFDGDESDVFALQDHVTTRIVNAIDRTMVVNAARDSEKRKNSPEAGDLMLRAWASRLTPASEKRAQHAESLYRQALALEPDNAVAMVGLANAIAAQANEFDFNLDEKGREKHFAESREWALKAKELDPGIPGVYVALGVYAANHNDFSGFRHAAEARLALEPRNPVSYFNLADTYLSAADPRRAIELMKQGIDLDPKGVREVPMQLLAYAYFMSGDYDASIQWSQKCLERNPKYVYAYVTSAMSYALTGDQAKSRAAVAEVRRLEPNLKLERSDRPKSSFPDAARDFFDKKFLPAWRLAGLPEQ